MEGLIRCLVLAWTLSLWRTFDPCSPRGWSLGIGSSFRIQPAVTSAKDPVLGGWSLPALLLTICHPTPLLPVESLLKTRLSDGDDDASQCTAFCHQSPRGSGQDLALKATCAWARAYVRSFRQWLSYSPSPFLSFLKLIHSLLSENPSSRSPFD